MTIPWFNLSKTDVADQHDVDVIREREKEGRNRTGTMQTGRCCARRLHREQWSLYDAECRYLMTTRRIKFQAPTELALPTAGASKRIRIGEHLLYSPAAHSRKFCPCAVSDATPAMRMFPYEHVGMTFILISLFFIRVVPPQLILDCKK